MRLAIVTLVLCTAVCSRCSADDTALEPLDIRTRSILVFRECLLDLVDADLNSALRHIADGSGGSTYQINRKAPTFNEEENGERKNVKAFITKNFPRVESIHDDFSDILFSRTMKQPETITVIDKADGSEREGLLYAMAIKIPDVSDTRPIELKFVAVGKLLYWVPFGW
jgi:hypothetical protein